MVKLFGFLKRRAGTSAAEFDDYWVRRHVPFFAETPDVARHLRRYELHHRLGADEVREHGDGEVADAGFDGVAVQWFDSVADFRALREEPSYREFSAADAPRYRAPDIASVITRDPDIIVGPPGGAPEQGCRSSASCVASRASTWPTSTSMGSITMGRCSKPSPSCATRCSATSRTTGSICPTPRSTGSPNSGSPPSMLGYSRWRCPHITTSCHRTWHRSS